jgi:predicted ribosome quality control (RQC) complex YloA/Tae2 family protein
VVLYRSKNIKDPKINIFPQILGKTIDEFKIVNYDKSMYLYCDKYIIEMIFYGKNPNIYLYDETKALITAFKKIRQRQEIKNDDIVFDPATIDYNAFVKLISKDKGKSCLKFISQHIGGFNQLLAREICYRCETLPETMINSLNESKQKTIIEMIATITREIIHNNAPYLIK